MTFQSPQTVRDLSSRFGDDASCRAALAEIRWGAGFVCPACSGTAAGHATARDLMLCRSCGRQVSSTGDTLLHRSHAEFCFRREFREPGAAFEALLRGLVSPR